MEFKTLFLSFILISLGFSSAFAQTSCQNSNFASTQEFKACIDHPVLNTFLHWTYFPSNTSMKLAFRRPNTTSDTWIAWAINPLGLSMSGSQALVAHLNPDGIPLAYTSNVASVAIDTLVRGNLSFRVPELSASYLNNELIIYATVLLPANTTTINQIWQIGPMFGGSPGMHSLTGDNRNSRNTLDLLSGTSTVTAVDYVLRKRYIHGVLNAVSWGTLMPIGALFARYLKVFKSADPAWFYLHITCQITAYFVGVAGWASGIILGRQSTSVHYSTHRNIGITLFVLATIQVFAMCFRPNKDHKYRVYWNIYHHSMGYSVIILSIINVFEGLKILCPDSIWQQIYTGIIVSLGVVAVILEAVTWYIVIKRKKSDSDKIQDDINGIDVDEHAAIGENKV